MKETSLDLHEAIHLPPEAAKELRKEAQELNKKRGRILTGLRNWKETWPLLFGTGALLASLLFALLARDECYCNWIPLLISVGLVFGGWVCIRARLLEKLKLLCTRRPALVWILTLATAGCMAWALASPKHEIAAAGGAVILQAALWLVVSRVRLAALTTFVLIPALILAPFSLNADEAPPPPPSRSCSLGPVLWVVAVTITVAGTVVVGWVAIRACMRIMRQHQERDRQNNPPDDPNELDPNRDPNNPRQQPPPPMEEGDETQSSIKKCGEFGTCPPGLAEEFNSNRTYIVLTAVNNALTGCRLVKNSELVPVSEWTDQVHRAGLFLEDGSYAINGLPAPEDATRWIHWDGPTCYVLSAEQHLSIEGSTDLKYWEPILDAWVPRDSVNEMTDSYSEKVLYFRAK